MVSAKHENGSFDVVLSHHTGVSPSKSSSDVAFVLMENPSVLCREKTMLEICDAIVMKKQPGSVVVLRYVDGDDLRYFFSRDDILLSEITFYNYIPNTYIDRVQKSLKQFTLTMWIVSSKFFDDIAAFFENVCINIEAIKLDLYYFKIDDLYAFLSKICLPATVKSIEIILGACMYDLHDKHIFDLHRSGNLMTIENVILEIDHVKYIEKKSSS